MKTKYDKLENNMYLIDQGVTEEIINIQDLDRDLLLYLYDAQEIPETKGIDYSNKELQELIIQGYDSAYFTRGE